jgi:hypothetical protein
MSDRYVLLSEFSRATGRRLDFIKQEISDGNLPTEPGRLLGRNELGEPIFSHIISVDEIPRYRVKDAVSTEDPAIRSAEVRRAAYAKRDHSLAVETGDPDALIEEGKRVIESINERQRSAIQAYNAAKKEK